MEGRKTCQEKLFIIFRLSEGVPENNFYRRLRQRLDLSFVRKLTKGYYGSEGQKSIDAEVFFKLMVTGYLENINSDRKILEQASMRLDMLYFLGYDIDEELPCHSTLSRTRKLFGQEVFLEVFRNILGLCIERGMVDGKRQAVDSAFIKANASKDSLVEKELVKESTIYYDTLTSNEEISSNKSVKHSDKFTSVSDPDSRLSQKPGKVPQLNYSGQISVDTASHVICGAMADFADTKDSDSMPAIVGQAVDNLKENGMKKVYTKGISLANKHVLMAGAAYNLKKLLAYRQFKAVTMAMQNMASNINEFISNLKSGCLSPNFSKI